jgi:hypothetical protein
MTLVVNVVYVVVPLAFVSINQASIWQSSVFLAG